MHIVSGVKIQKLMPTIKSASARATAFFDLLHPHSMDFSFDNIRRFINTPFVLKTKSAKMVATWGRKPMVILRGGSAGDSLTTSYM